MPSQTSVARLSLASASTPATRTDHSLYVRARRTGGVDGVVRAALYEGSTDRSGTLETSTLSSSFALYRLSISDSAAASITSYSNLEIRLWGYVVSGGAVVFDIAEAWLEMPLAGAAGTQYGQVVLPIVGSVWTAGAVPGGQPTTNVARLSLDEAQDPGTDDDHIIVVRARVSGGSGTFWAALYEGANNRSGDLESDSLTSAFADYHLMLSTASAASITSYADLELRLWGESAATGATFDLADAYLSLPPGTGAASVTVGIATDTSSAAALTYTQDYPPVYPGLNVYPSETYGGDLGGMVVGIATEISTALALTATGAAAVVTVGIATETSYGIERPVPVPRTVGIATESSIALAVGSLGGASVLTVGIAVEINLPGRISGSGDIITRSVIKDGEEDLVIGARMVTGEPSYSYDGYFVGVLDELALLGSAISDQEVKDLYSRMRHAGADTASYQSTTGIWGAATNLLPNGGFEGGVSGWSAVSGATVSQETTDAYLGDACLKFVADAIGEGVTTSSVVTSVSQTHTFSVWVKGSGLARLELEERTSGDSLVGTTNGSDFTLEGSWKRVSVTRAFGGTGARARVRVIARSSVVTAYADGAQLEQRGFPTPYVETNGIAATRSAARMQVSAGYADEQQGWVAARIDLGWGNAAEPSEDAVIFDWRDSTSALLTLFYDVSANSFVMTRTDGIDPAQVSVAYPLAPGERVTVIAAWTATGVKLSVAGAPFAFDSGTGVPSLSSSTFDLGSSGGSSGYLNGSFVWFACGVGTLSDTDTLLLHEWSDEPPRLHTYPTVALVRFAWDGVDEWGVEAGQTHSLTQGQIRRIFHQPGPRRSTTQLELIDAMERLNTEMGVLAAAPEGETMGEAIARILARVGMEDPSVQDLDTGEYDLTHVSNDGTKTWLQILVDIVMSDFGMFNIDANGHAVFRERRSRALAPYVGRLSRELRRLEPGVDVDRVVNTWTVVADDRDEGATGDPYSAIATFQRSSRRYGIRYSEQRAAHLATADQAYSLAEHLVRRTAEPDAPVYAVSMSNRSDRQLAFCLGLEVGDMLGIFGQKTIGYYIVEQISAEANVEEGHHEVSLVVSAL